MHDTNPKIVIVAAVFHQEIVRKMITACKQVLSEHEILDVSVVEVPGAFEIPITSKKLALTKKYDCIIALGVVIKGETMHFELVSEVCAQGVMEVMLATSVPIVFEVLSVYSKEQALHRSDGEHNKGREAAYTALKLLSTLENVEKISSSTSS